MCAIGLLARRAFSFCRSALLIASLLLSAFSAFAQLPVIPAQVFASAAAFTVTCNGQDAIGTGAPTNQAGYPAYTWYVACGTYGTNSSVATWTNLTSNTGLNLTNHSTGSGAPIHQANLNGYSTLGWVANGSDYLQNNGYSVPSSSQFEIILVAAITNASTGYVWADNDSGNNLNGALMLDDTGPSQLGIYAGSTAFSLNLNAGTTNKYAVFDAVLNGATTVIYTNNVAGATINPGTFGLTSGFTIPGAHAESPQAVAELIVYRTNLTTLVRSNVFFYLTNKYAIHP